MSKIPTLSAYLKSKGVNDETSILEVEELKKIYWKAYHKNYYQQRKKDYKRLTLRLTKEEYDRLQIHAKEYSDLSFSTFIKQSALAYLEQNYIPQNPQEISALTKAIRKIGNVINQVVQSIHRTAKRGNLSGAFSDEGDLKKLHQEYDFLVGRVTAIEQEVENFMGKPTEKIGVVLTKILLQDPSKIVTVRALLDKIESQK